MARIGTKLLGTLAAGAGAYYVYTEYGGCTYKGNEDLTGNVYVFTGSTSPGIGKETARELAKRGATVILGAKNLDRCHQARQQILASTEYKNHEVNCAYLDLKSIKSIRQFVKDLPQDLKLKAVVNAAETVMKNTREETHDGLEKQIGVSHFGHSLLTKLLVEKYPGASFRVLPIYYPPMSKNVQINLQDLNRTAAYDKYDVYNEAKLATLLSAYEGAKRLSTKSNVTINAVDPGKCNTEIYRHYSGTSSFFVKLGIQPVLMFIYTSPNKAAHTVLHAVLSPELENVSGKLVRSCKTVELPLSNVQKKSAESLWNLTEKVLADPEKFVAEQKTSGKSS